MKKLAIATFAAAAVLITGCSTTGSESIKSQSKIDSITLKKTTKNEVLEMFGPPNGRSEGANEDTWTYGYTNVKMIPFASSVDSRLLQITFDKRGVVTGKQFQKEGN